MARFCPACGERLSVRRARFLPARAVCRRCGASSWSGALLVGIALTLCFGAGMIMGHYGRRPEPFYIIGTPVNHDSGHASQPVEGEGTQRSASETRFEPSLARHAVSICGARTKSGGVCQRKVPAGQKCWQHRDRAGASPVPAADNNSGR